MSDSQIPPQAHSDETGLTLRIRGLGHVPAFKNHKMLTRGKLRTDPRKQKWMRAAEDCLAAELLSQYPTSDGETVTAANLRYWIQSSVPADDSCHYLTTCSWRFTSVPKGSEGANIEINRI